MVIAKARKCPDHYTYLSPLIGLQVNGSDKLQDASISKTSYKPHPYQKELAIHTNQNAVTKSLKHDCYLNIERSTTNDCYSTPCPSKEKSSASPKEQSLATDTPDSQPHTMKKMADTFKYVSTVFVKPDKLTTENNLTTHQSYFTPVSLEFLKEKRAGFAYKDMHASSNQGVRLSDPKVRSEYKYRFVPKEAPGNLSGRIRDQNGVRGCAKLNVTHNTITGDRFNFGSRKIGTTHNHDEYCPWPVERRNLANTSAVRNITCSIPKGDPDKEYQKQSSNHLSYQNPSTILKDLRFNTLSETHQKTFKTSFRYKSGAPDNFSTTTTADYSSKDGKASKIAGSAWTRGASSLPEGDLDLSRVHKIQATRGSYVTPSMSAYQKHIDHADMITQSTVQLGSPEYRPTSRVTTSGASYIPHANHRQHIIPVPKDKLILTPCKDFAQSSATHEDFQRSAARDAKAYGQAHKLNNNLDFTSRWGLLSREPSSYSTTHQAHFSNPATRVYLA